MGKNPSLEILGLQALPKLVKRFDFELEDFMTYSDLYRLNPEGSKEAWHNCGKILNRLLEEKRVSWWDVYLSSDIGMERIALAKDIGLEEDDTVLDVGCGRGYFTVAAAKLSRAAIGLDLMDGAGRKGWWNNFIDSITRLDLKHKIIGIKADAQIIPLRDCSVDKIVAVHSIRNLENKQVIQNSIREMNRVLSKNGEMAIAETIPDARNKSQEAHLSFYECKCKYSWGDIFYFSEKELLQILTEAGLKDLYVEIADYNLSAAPPIFYLNTSRLKKEQVTTAQKEYAEAVEMVKKYGETSPPTAIIKATKHRG